MIRIRDLLWIFPRRKFPFKFIYSDSYWMVDLGNHVFPIKKYRRIYEQLLSSGAKRDNFLAPKFLDDEDIQRVHSTKYLKKIRTGKLSQSEMVALEIPYIPEGVDFAFLTVGGTALAAEMALEDGLAIHIGGGFHHAFPDHGEGFCVLNDVAVALEKMRHDGYVQKVMVVDCDVHQGNGTAAIFAEKDYVFTFSIHQMDLYPAQKPSSSLDVGLWSGDGDEKYLAALHEHFPGIYKDFQPDLIFYLAGADAYENDQLGSLKLTVEGLAERDEIILRHARALGCPVAVVFAGGYAYDIEDTVNIHMNTIRVAKKVQQKYPA